MEIYYIRRQFAILIMALLFLTELASAEDEIVDLSHNGNGWNSFGEEADEIKGFQSFIVVATSIGRVQEKIRYLNGVAPNGDVIAEV